MVLLPRVDSAGDGMPSPWVVVVESASLSALTRSWSKAAGAFCFVLFLVVVASAAVVVAFFSRFTLGLVSAAVLLLALPPGAGRPGLPTPAAAPDVALVVTMLRLLRFLISPRRLMMVLGFAPVFAAYGPMWIFLESGRLVSSVWSVVEIWVVNQSYVEGDEESETLVRVGTMVTGECTKSEAMDLPGLGPVTRERARRGTLRP